MVFGKTTFRRLQGGVFHWKTIAFRPEGWKTTRGTSPTKVSGVYISADVKSLEKEQSFSRGFFLPLKHSPLTQEDHEVTQCIQSEPPQNGSPRRYPTTGHFRNGARGAILDMMRCRGETEKLADGTKWKKRGRGNATSPERLPKSSSRHKIHHFN